MRLVTKTSIITTKNEIGNKNINIRFRRNDVFHGSTSTAIKMLRDAVKYGNYKIVGIVR